MSVGTKTRAAGRSPRRRDAHEARKGERTRATILDRAVDLASAEGLEALTIGRLAADLKMSKSGLFAHFGSKEGHRGHTDKVRLPQVI